VGFTVGAFQFIAPLIPPIASYANVVPCPPVAAFIVGFLLYGILANLGLQSRTLDMPGESA